MGEGGGDAARKIGLDDGVKEKIVFLNNVDRI